ncbi:MAG: hypothetical protein OXN17_00635 [Candidatus Poribacteria bacterium]|nr:hypothetical protein [Candidatus Poribacteria bacterium]MDE0504279.1 hypothetical protein [Candidatus Poribacteria bacterium]
MSITPRKSNPLRTKLAYLLALVFIIGSVFSGAYYISAQEDTRPDRSGRRESGRGDRGGGRRGEFNLEEMVERQTRRAIEGLSLSEDEKTVLVPRIKAIAEYRLGRRQELRPLMQAVRSAVEAGDNMKIKAALDALKAKQNEQKTKSDSLEKSLVELLTVRQEAQLTVAGIVNNSGGFGGFGGRRGRTGGGDGRRGDRPRRDR